ncbi:MAG: hypothetical protein ACJAVK_001740 [Akkermansiaceae bacterium]|jgi:hypothetical protein
MMSNVQWFYADAQQQQQGPVAFEQIQELAASGQIQPATLIWNESMPNWTAASQVQGVFNAGPPPVISTPGNPYAAPGSGSPLGAPVAGGSYPIPPIKKSSFGLFISLFILGFILFFAGLALIAAQSVSAIMEVANETPQNIETREDAAQWEAQKAQKIEREFEENFINNPPIGGALAMLGGLLLVAIAWVLGRITLYRAWCLVQPGGARTTPGKAVGFLFIPFFNIYWTFEAYHGWSQDWNRIQAAHGNLAHLPRASSAFFLTTLILTLCIVVAIFIPVLNLLFIFGIPVLQTIMYAQIYRVVNGAAAASQPR